MIPLHTASSKSTRYDRIRVIRIQLFIRVRRAENMKNVKGITDFNTIHEFEIVEELSAALAKEKWLLAQEREHEKDMMSHIWENDIVDTIYDI